MSGLSEALVAEKLTSIEQLLKQMVKTQETTNSLLSKVLPTAISRIAEESQFRKIAKDESKTPKQRILAVLEYNPDGISLTSLSGQTNLARNTVRQHVDELVKKGLVRQDSVGGAAGTKCYAVISYEEALEQLRKVKLGPA